MNKAHPQALMFTRNPQNKLSYVVKSKLNRMVDQDVTGYEGLF